MIKIYAIAFLISSTSFVAQTSTVSSGGTASGSGGTATYTIGQAFYQMPAGNGFSTLQGVQQPIEIVELATDEVEEPVLNIKIYPNPTTSEFFISFPEQEYLNSQYLLSDLSGKEISRSKIVSAQTKVITDGLPQGVYVLKIKTLTAERAYKIIKR